MRPRIDRWAAMDCALFVWTTPPTIHEYACPLIEAWGFQYKTFGFTWVKLSGGGEPFMGMGYYTRGNAEICLLATRRKPKVKAHDVNQVILSPRREHSRKPDEQYSRIERLFDGPYLEIFARERRPGWDAWGNEV